MAETTIVKLSDNKGQDGLLWHGAKVDPDGLPRLIEGILSYARGMIQDGPRDHPTRVYVEKPSERFLASMTPVLGLKRIEWGLTVKWQVAISEETDRVDPVFARNINTFLVQRLQSFFWKKDACFVVESALSEPTSNLIAVNFSRIREG